MPDPRECGTDRDGPRLDTSRVAPKRPWRAPTVIASSIANATTDADTLLTIDDGGFFTSAYS